MTLDIRVTDIPEVRSAIAAGIADGLRDQAPVPEWWTRAYYAERLGVPVNTINNRPWLLPPTADGPTSTACIRRADAERWLAMTVTQMRDAYRERVSAQKLRVVK